MNLIDLGHVMQALLLLCTVGPLLFVFAQWWASR